MKLYWSNLFRIRFWWFLLLAPAVAAALLGALFPPLAFAYFLLLPLAAYCFLSIQMACGMCGSLLATTKLQDVEVCKRCQYPTDSGLAKQAEFQAKYGRQL